MLAGCIYRNMEAKHTSSLLSPSCLSWEAFLPNHGIFKALRKDFKLPSEEAYLGRNILVEKDGDLFLWDDDQKRIFVANLKNLKAKNERSSKLQTLLCTSRPSFSVSKMVFSETGAYLALVGSRGVSVLELPQKRGKFTQFEHGKESITCRTVHLDEHFFTCHITISIFEAKWFPGSLDDVHLVVLTSDNRIRIFNITKPYSPQDIISVGTVPPDQSLCSPVNATFAEAFGEVVVSFDFAPAINVELTRAENTERAYPVFLLRENGDVLYLLLVLMVNEFYYELHGYLSMFPPAEDNYGVDSCTILCFPTNPVVIAITTCGGIIYHCIALDNEEGDVFDATLVDSVGVRNSESDVRCLAPKISLYVYESIELALLPSSDIDRNFDELSKFACDDKESKEESCTVKLFKDPASESRYHCYHPSGVHTVMLPWLKNLQQFCNETDRIVSFDINQDGKVQHLICTNPVPSSPLNLTGFTVVSDWDLGATIIALTDNMECITKPLRFLNRPPSPVLLSTSPETKPDVDNRGFSSSLHTHLGEFENRIKHILRRDSSNPLVRSGPESPQCSSKDCFQFLAGATEIFHLEYINKQKLAQEEIERRVKILREQSAKQKEDLHLIKDEKQTLRNRIEMLAEKYEDVKDRQEYILKRIQNVLEFVQSRQPILSDAEERMKKELDEVSHNIQTLQKSFDQLQHKRKYLRDAMDKTWEPKARNLTESHKKQLRELLKQEGTAIQNLVQQVNNLKIEVGF